MKRDLNGGGLWRVLVGLGLPAIAVMAVQYLLSGRGGIPCVFYSLTGFYCAGCGSGRTLEALLRGDLRHLFSYNVLLIPLGVPCLIVLVHEYLRIVFPKLKLKPVYIPQGVSYLLAGMIAVFWVLRNIPAFSFLAPAG